MFTRWSFTARVSNCFIFLAVGQRFAGWKATDDFHVWLHSSKQFTKFISPFDHFENLRQLSFGYRRRPFQVAQLRKAVTQTRVFRWLCISGKGWSFRFNADDDPYNFLGIFIFFFLMFLLFLKFVDENQNWWKLRFVNELSNNNKTHFEKLGLSFWLFIEKFDYFSYIRR